MKTTFLAASLLLVGLAAQAQTATPRLDARQARQQARINQGVATGRLTPAEAARVQNRQATIDAKQQAAQADGVVTPGERRNIRRTENRTSRAIYRQKHDGQGLR